MSTEKPVVIGLIPTKKIDVARLKSEPCMSRSRSRSPCRACERFALFTITSMDVSNEDTTEMILTGPGSSRGKESPV
jgi:hypothetical protein